MRQIHYVTDINSINFQYSTPRECYIEIYLSICFKADIFIKTHKVMRVIRIPSNSDFEICFPWYTTEGEILTPLNLEEYTIRAQKSINSGCSWESLPSDWELRTQGNLIFIRVKAGLSASVISFKFTAMNSVHELSCTWRNPLQIVKWSNSVNYSEYVQGAPYLMPSNISVYTEYPNSYQSELDALLLRIQTLEETVSLLSERVSALEGQHTEPIEQPTEPIES